METPEPPIERHGDRSNDALAEALTALGVSMMQVAMAVQLLAEVANVPGAARNRLMHTAGNEARKALERTAQIVAPYLGPEASIRSEEDMEDG